MKYVKQKKFLFLVWFLSVLLAACYTWWQLDQIQRGRLFLFPLAGESSPSAFEMYDAKESARKLTTPAIACVILLGSLVTFYILNHQRVPIHRSRLWKVLAGILVAAAILDLVTTIQFFRKQGIHLELHPGIRLFGYAYGRTTGPLLGKTLQLVGILWMSRLLGKMGETLLLIAIAAYLAGGIYNLSQV